MSKKLLFIVNDAGFFLSHRVDIARAAAKAGFEVHVVTKPSNKIQNIEALGFQHSTIPLSRSGLNIAAELRLIVALFRTLKRVKPDVLHLVTIKPVLYGGILARIAGVPAVVSAISGLGYVFNQNNSCFRRILKQLTLRGYRIALSHKNQHVIFQNSYDLQTLGKINSNHTLIPGSGVNLDRYNYQPEPEGPPVVTMAARLVKEKGVLEFIRAAEILSDRGVKVNCQLVGEPDIGNPKGITENQFQQWKSEGTVTCLGYRKDIPEIFAASNIVVLPSYYREGLPRVLIEAAACGRAVITTDHPGCRDAILPNVTGLLVACEDAENLANAIEQLCVDPNKRKDMGNAGRKMAIERYSIEDVVSKHISIYDELLKRSSTCRIADASNSDFSDRNIS